ncbi:hypothetical protein EVAR_12036_1 [Eumeta japonica]|uniref:Uncharacterized protein n=1 Tax=Eumeta variegata TaxID=151549 RepID=A0A4C1U4W2_EUMVA|nr:hypothetical protein EVAR_12036_1 [Eumeta japonica]
MLAQGPPESSLHYVDYTIVNLVAAQKWAGSNGEICRTEYECEVEAFAVVFRQGCVSVKFTVAHCAAI